MADISYHKYFDELVSLRREFHKIPEICYQEVKTAEKIEEFLINCGITTVKRVFKTGVVCTIGDESKECIALRMDTDGLPVSEETGVSYQSRHTGMMHACGHDAHIAILLVTAKILKEHESMLQKCVKLIFQPGEEGDGGALPMIKEGVLENPKVTKIFGAHLWPDTPVGEIEYLCDTAFAGCDRYEIKIHGKGGHGAIPESANSPLPALADCILGIEALGKEEPDAVISACACNADGYYNVFPDDAALKGTIRTLSPEQRTRILDSLDLLVKEISDKRNITVEFLPVEEYPPCLQDEGALTEYLFAAMRVFGEDYPEKIKEGKRTFAAEDFSFFAKEIPAAHVRIGSQGGEDSAYPLHHAKFQIDENCLMVGVKLFCEIIFGQR
ncbi:MAG: amidohydrolase [Ruminococcaceae bacterium]|nr:amidohydrolase [Oscillospiraceae bacterium]